MPFEEAREYVRSLNLKSASDWFVYSKTDKKPQDIPYSVQNTYKDSGWISWGDFLGTQAVAFYNIKYLSYDDAKHFVQNLNLKNVKEWNEYCKTGNKPKNIPYQASNTYLNKGWKGWGDFLGTGNISNSNRGYRSFKEARNFARSLNLKSGNEWKVFCKSGNKPEDIPSAPNRVYKGKGWKGIGDWLGTGSKATQERGYRSFKEARSFARSLNFKSGNEWRAFCKSGKKPQDIPAGINRTYKDSGWISWGDFLGTGNKATNESECRSFEEAREFARSLNLKTGSEWKAFCRTNKKPQDIPSNPRSVYKNLGWKSNGDWLGTGNVANYNKEYRSFEEAREFVRSLKLRGQKEWRTFCRTNKKPQDIPSNPRSVYKNLGWKSNGDWLGTGNLAPRYKVYMSFEEAREFVRSLNLKSSSEWFVYSKTDKKPIDIPSGVSSLYKSKGWNGWGDFLGNEK